MACSSSTWQPGGAANSRPTPPRLPHFEDRRLGSIRPSETQAWVRGLEQDLAPSTIGVVYSFLAGIFRAAVRDRLIVASPCDGIRLPRPEPKRVEPLATEKVEALIEAMPARYRALVMLAAAPGRGLRGGGGGDRLPAPDAAGRPPTLDATRKPDPKRRPAALVFTSLTGGRCGGPGSPTSGDPRRPQPGSATE
jgi:hypothetical protein